MMKMVSRFRILLLMLLSATFVAHAADTLNEVDSLLKLYDKSQLMQRKVVGRMLLEIYDQSEILFYPSPTLSSSTPKDTVDLQVWFGAERYYTTNAYFDKALEYNRRAMPLAKKGQPDILATLLCDRCYALYKTSEHTKAIEAGKEAMHASRQAGNVMQLSRAYLYLGIVNYSMMNYDEAKVLVEKAILTNRKLGKNEQMHNTLGVACEIYTGAGEVERAIECGLQAVDEAQAIDYQPGVANHLREDSGTT